MSVMDRVLGERERLKRRRRRRWLGFGLLLCLGIAAVTVLSRGKEAPRYPMAEVRRGTLPVRVTATGTLQPTTVVTVGSEVSGTAADVLADVNDHVGRGQILMRLDSTRLHDAVAHSAAALDAANAGVAQALATERQVETTLGRQREVARLSGGLTPSQLELDTAAADLARARANVRSARATATQARAQLSSDRFNLDRGTIVSPIDGVILTRSIEPGQTVAATFETPNLFLIARDLHAMKLQLKIDEADVGLVKAGEPAAFRVDAFPGRTWQARVVRVDTASVGFGARSEGKAGSGDAVVAYSAVLEVANPDLSLQPGMTATATIQVAHLDDVLLLPNAALRFRPKTDEPAGAMKLSVGPSRDDQVKQVAIGRGRTQDVYVLGSDGTLRPVRVTVGPSDGGLTAVTSPGLRAKANVVTGQAVAAR